MRVLKNIIEKIYGQFLKYELKMSVEFFCILFCRFFSVFIFQGYNVYILKVYVKWK